MSRLTKPELFAPCFPMLSIKKSGIEVDADNVQFSFVVGNESIDCEIKAVEKRIQCRIEAISPAQVVSLIKIGTSIKDGMSSAQDWFEVIPEKSTLEPPKLTLNDDEFDAALEQLNAGAIDKAYILDGYSLTDAQRVAVEAQ